MHQELQSPWAGGGTGEAVDGAAVGCLVFGAAVSPSGRLGSLVVGCFVVGGDVGLRVVGTGVADPSQTCSAHHCLSEAGGRLTVVPCLVDTSAQP